MAVKNAKAGIAQAKRVTIKLFKDNGRYSQPFFVGLNDYTALIQRGVPVSVPYPVAMMIEESQAQEGHAMEYMNAARYKD